MHDQWDNRPTNPVTQRIVLKIVRIYMLLVDCGAASSRPGRFQAKKMLLAVGVCGAEYNKPAVQCTYVLSDMQFYL